MKVVINAGVGGFGLSSEARELIGLRGDVDCISLNRSDSCLVKVVEELGDKANDELSSLSVVEIPDGTDYEICEDHGSEWVAEKHRKWYAEV